jgi:signal transduction histidine kinase
MIVVILAAIAAAWRRTPAPRRPQVRLVAVTLFVAAAATLLLTTLPVALGGEPLVTRGVEALLALPVLAAIALAVVRDRLFQVDLLVSSRARIVAAREEERLRLRRELHDGLGPTLAALGLKVDAARAAAADDPSGVAPLLDEIRGDVRSILGEVRTMARGLRPPTIDSLGLVGGLRQQVEALATGMGTQVEVVADELPELPPGVEVAAYRIVVEAVTNVVRHAAATRASVRLIIDGDMLRIDVTDDGVGMDAGAIGVGTRAMYERAAEVGGELTIEPGPAVGTVVTALLPLGRRAAGPASPAIDGSDAP